MDPVISVIIPVYNVESYIRQCLDSIVNQTYRNLEIIIIDDGSPDHCGEICDEYAAKDRRISVVHKKNGGLSAARNDGIRKATGDWIAFVDSDDWCELDYYKKLMAASKGKTPDIVFAGGYYKEYPSKCRKVQVIRSDCSYSDYERLEELRFGIITYGLPWDKLYRAEFLKRNRFSFDTEIRAFEDFLFNFKVFEKAKDAILCTSVGYHYRQTTASISSGFNPDKPRIVYDFLSKLHKEAIEYGMSPKIEDGINAVAICAISVALDCYFFHPANPKERTAVNKELNEMLNQPIFHEAIYSRSNRYLSQRQLILKYALKMNPGGGTSHPSCGKAENGAVVQRFQSRNCSSHACR